MEQKLTNSPEWWPEKKKKRKEVEGVVLPQTKKVKIVERISCQPSLEATSGSLVLEEEPNDENMELKKEIKMEPIEIKEEHREFKVEYVEPIEFKKELNDENIKLKEESKDGYIEQGARSETFVSGLVPKIEYQEEESIESKYNIKQEFNPLTDWSVKKEESEDESEDGHLVTETSTEHVQDIIAGKKRIHFLDFKGLVECGKLKKEDLALMKSARVVEVPGKGEVIQFLGTSSSVRNFNKIDLKELSIDDVEPGMGRRQLLVMAEVNRMFSKKGTLLMCKPCRIVHSDVKSMMNHIKDSHADLLTGGSGPKAKHKAKRTIRTRLYKLINTTTMIGSTWLFEGVQGHI